MTGKSEYVVRVSYLNYFLEIVLLALCIFLFVYGLSHWPWSYNWVQVNKVHIPLSIFGLPAFLLLVSILGRRYNEKLVITDRYLLFLHGILRWKQESVRIEYNSIKEVNIEETIPQRLFGLGNLSCSTAASTEDLTLSTIHGISNPRRLKDDIMLRMKAALSEVRE